MLQMRCAKAAFVSSQDLVDVGRSALAGTSSHAAILQKAPVVVCLIIYRGSLLVSILETFAQLASSTLTALLSLAGCKPYQIEVWDMC